MRVSTAVPLCYVLNLLLYDVISSDSLQKQGYSNILKMSPPKTESFQIKKF